MLTQVNHYIRKSLVIFLLVVFMTIFCLSGVKAGLSDFELVTDNGCLELYINESTTEIAVQVKETGDIWYSNPSDRQTMENLARGAAKERLNSQLSIGYYIGNQLITLDSYTESVLHDQYNIVPIENGVKVKYLIGKEWADKDYLPLVISQEEFDVLLSKLDNDDDREFVRDLYALFTLEHGYEAPDKISVLGVDLDKLFGEYGLKIEEARFRANDKRRLIQEYLKAVQEYKGYASLGGVKTEDIEAVFDTPTLMRKWNIMVWDQEDAISLIKGSGYSPDNIIEEHLKYNVTPPSKNLQIFEIAIEYIIDGDELVVRIPSDEVLYPKNVIDPTSDKSISFPLTTISVLPYFGAGNKEETGYIFVPDGSGALIKMNSGKTSAQPYRQTVYGRDHSTSAVREYTYDLDSQIHLPVFGAKHQDKAFLAIIESGDSFARINAAIAGMTDSYNKVFSSFAYIPNARVYMQSGGAVIYMRDLSINMYQARPYLNDIAIRYTFLADDQADYSGMAQRYQKYLVERHGLKRLDQTESIPLLIELIGGIEKTEPVYGVSKNVVKPVTSYEQTESVVDHFLHEGIGQLVVRYSGWLKGGMEHVFPSRVKVEPRLGTEGQLKELAASLRAKDVEFYPNVNFLNVYKTSLFDNYIQFRDSARALDRNPAYLNRYNLATHMRIRGEEISLLSPGELPIVIDGFLEDYLQLGISGLSFDVLGYQLYADYKVNADELIDRVQAKDIVMEQMSKLRNQQLSLMVGGANVYTLPYADFVVELPQCSRNYEIIDQGIPFYQMVLRGYIPYAGEPGNLTKRSQTYLLKLLETGAVPYYLLSYADSVEVKASRFESLYSINYLEHSENIVNVYSNVNSILKSIWHERIIEHESLGINVYRTQYEGGTSIIVNYNSESVEVLGLEIPGYGYRILRGGDQIGQEN